jgi:hypothetical protein
MSSSVTSSALIKNFEEHLNKNLRSGTSAVEHTWGVVSEVAERARRRNWEAFLVGGALRDIALTDGAKKPRDIDIVFGGASMGDLFEEFRDFTFVRRTSFGGICLRHKEVFLDVWPLVGSFRGGRNSSASIEDVPKHAFLNIEAIAVDIAVQNDASRRFFESGFFEGISRKTVEINFASNPFPEISVLRALRSSIRFNLMVGTTLVGYIRDREWSVHRFLQEELRHYGENVFEESDLNTIFRIFDDCDADRFSLNLELNKRNVLSDLLKRLTRSTNTASLFQR